ncbi:MAG TPA: diguanylate cyclase, partial [Solirubrobacteraceae bacterium]
LFVVLLRMVLAVEALERSRREALTDGLTGLGNRRRLLLDLRTRLRDGERPFTLALFDLDGFKGYNDAFGHLSGDALLSLLAERLALAVAPGRAYRMGGDEFCALIDATGAAAGEPLAAASAALAEQGERFDVRASAGVVTLPVESRDVREALTMADMRMYAEKGRRRGDRAAVLSGLLGESGHDGGSAEPWLVDVAMRVGRRLGLSETEVDRVGRATALHDVGKMAMPEDIVRKRGPLDADEWRLMRQHPVVGERLLRSTPALASVAPLVRSSHERWDGGGYPDGLAGEEIELGARIVGVCDAYAAMRSPRPHRAPLDRDTALAELERGAGGQFDPEVVAAFRAELPE